MNFNFIAYNGDSREPIEINIEIETYDKVYNDESFMRTFQNDFIRFWNKEYKTQWIKPFNTIVNDILVGKMVLKKCKDYDKVKETYPEL